MGWLFGQGPEAGELSEKVRESLFIQFGMSQVRISQLRCAQRGSRLEGRQIRQIRIFDPALFERGSPPIQKFEELDRYPKAVLFHGHIEKQGPVHLTKSQSFDESELQKLPNIVSNLLVERYHVDPQLVEDLGWVAKIGDRAGEQVRLVRIFDPASREVEAPAIRGYDDLDRYPNTILFSGYIDRKNALYLSAQSPQPQTRDTQFIGKGKRRGRRDVTSSSPIRPLPTVTFWINCKTCQPSKQRQSSRFSFPPRRWLT